MGGLRAARPAGVAGGRCYSAAVIRLRLGALTTAGACLCVTFACGAADPDNAPGAAAPEETATPVTSSGMAYPAVYKDMGLPELPGGEVTSAGRQAMSLRDGLSIQVRTTMSVDEAREYYSTVLAGLGWEEQPSRVIPGMPMTGLQAIKDDLRYTVTITASPDGEGRVSISVLQQ